MLPSPDNTEGLQAPALAEFNNRLFALEKKLARSGAHKTRIMDTQINSKSGAGVFHKINVLQDLVRIKVMFDSMRHAFRHSDDISNISHTK